MTTPKETKREKQKRMWVEDTQMFQRVSKIPVSSAEELGAEWETLVSPRKTK